MPTEKEVYEQHADQYERLIRREDYEGNILRAIEQIVPLPGLEVVELGAGTGRLTRLLAPRVRAIRAFDGSRHMLDVAEESLRQMGLANWQAGVADNRAIPVADASADLVISGWSFCYLAVWGGPSTGSGWLGELEKGYGEIKRILRPGGTAIILETMGTGHESPHPPEHLAGYYGWLKEVGFQSTWIRTDYRFESLEEARELATFFFGEAMGREVVEKNWQVLPECTGAWWTKT
ncbi:MAG: class I SAM-dependent methyltransferase [Chloroflexi bacterium]|nr:MAG: class I SAM-dependent methyltransferase [Chloroflexota bacterium]